MKELLTQTKIEYVAEPNQLTPAEKHQLLVEFNNTKVDHPLDKTVIDLFEKQVEEHPGDIAIIFDEKHLTYQELNEKSNQLAHYLKSKSVKRETLVPICIERSPEMIIGILGILKAGGAYVPIDTDYPLERIKYILEDTNAAIAISSRESKLKLLSAKNIDVIELNEPHSVINQQSISNINNAVKTYNLVYVIYTSGSTGKPKGVMIEHGGLTNLTLSQIEIFQLKPRMKTLQFAAFGFDASCSEIFTALLSGGCLVLPQKKHLLSAEEFEKLINKHSVEVVTLPPSYQHVVKDSLGTLNTIISAGEPLNESVGKYLRLKGIRLLNGYGPTENTVCTCMSDDPIKDNHIIVIGKPVPNVQVYILDKEGDLCPIGVTGEICVAGVQVARGYLNREDLTEQKFVVNPFETDTETRMYKTGDLGRWLPNGNIEFMGRIDDQVKIRGYRIELGEVEAVLHQCELVKQAVVLTKEDKEGNNILVAYIVAEKIFDKKAITAFLKIKLPEYMVPAIFIQLDKFSTTPNGKIDKKALPDPYTTDLVNGEYIAPRTKVQKQLATIWREIFRIEQIGIQDNFFELGGNSIKAVQVVSYVKRTGYDLQPSDFFIHQTIEDLSKIITHRLHSNKSLHHINREEKFIIPMQTTGKKIPFFFMSPGFSVYDKVIPALDTEQPFYFFIPYSYKSVEEIAECYIREMKKIQPKGPYCLGGYCGFGEVALEMAQQLTAEGEEVALLALFEFYFPAVIKPFKLKERFEYYQEQLRNVTTGRKFLLLTDLVYRQLRRFKRKTTKAIDIKFRNLPDKSGYFIGKGLYTAKPYNGKILLFKSAIRTLRIIEEPLMGWSNYFSNAELFIIDGNHKTMFYNPGSIQIAQKLNEYAVLKEKD
jgi:amino acid adenylation domain-containing protein